MIIPSAARADCASPAGTAGKVIFDETSATMQYCNGAAWIKFPKFDPPSGWAQISGGGEWNNPFSCGITNEGVGWCWGTDVSGRLGNGPAVTAMQVTPYPIAGSHTWAQLSLSENHACGIRTDSVAMCWGDGEFGRLGNNSWSDSDIPGIVLGGHTWSKISSGRDHTCGIRTDGVAMCWGSDGNGELGNGATGDTAVPGVVSGGYSWADISAGDDHSCGVTTAGVGYCWGSAADGRLGNGTTTPNVQTPSLVLGGHTWRTIGARGAGRSCGLTTAGDAYCWGSDYEGRLGNGGADTAVSSPSLVSGSHVFRAIDVAIDSTCGLTTANGLYCWGSEAWGSSGYGGTSNVPADVSHGHAWASVGGGPAVRCGVRTDGVAMCWGRADSGALGNGTTTPDAYAPVALADTVNTCTVGTWTLRSPPSTFGAESVTFGNGIFVAGGTGGPPWMITSPDGITWTERTTPIAFSADDITYGNGVFVAVDNGNGNVLRSVDGITWTSHAVPQANEWRGVAYGNGMFVAVSSNGTNRVMTSPDGITWTVRNAAEANFWNSVRYLNGQFIAVASTGTNRAMTSPDGITWTARAIPSGTWYDVAYGKGLYVAVMDGSSTAVATSPDGITWTSRTTPNEPWMAITYGNGMFVATAWGGANRIMTSPDGINWTATTSPQLSVLPGVAYGNGTFVIVSNDGTNRAITASCLANCSNPTSPAGTIMYSDTRRVMQWCDGTSWHSMGPDNPGGASGGCSNPTGGAGKMILNADHFTMQYCDGGTWRSVGKVCEPYECGLVHHWKLDETTVTAGSTIVDSIGGRNGTVTGTLNSVPGKNGGGILFDADSEFVGNIGTLDAFTNKTQFTFSAWVKRTSAGSRIVLGDYASATVSSAYLGTMDDGWMYWGVGNSSTGADDEASYANNDTNWHMMTLVYNGTLSGNSNRLRVYLDGVNIGSPNYAGTIPATSYASGLPFLIGMAPTPFYSRGTIDDVRIYNRALSAPDVAALYNATRDPCVAASPVIGSVCADGSIYAGLSPDGNVKMYTTAGNAPTTHVWNSNAVFSNTSVVDCTLDNETGCYTGEANTQILATLADAGAPYSAAQYCYDLVENGADDWYLPSKQELMVLYNNRSLFPDLDGGSGAYPYNRYWTSSEDTQFNVNDAINIYMFDGAENLSGNKGNSLRVRCVRK